MQPHPAHVAPCSPFNPMHSSSSMQPRSPPCIHAASGTCSCVMAHAAGPSKGDSIGFVPAC
eukprot:364546-Chlamydomonas_euryale.AAC.13